MNVKKPQTHLFTGLLVNIQFARPTGPTKCMLPSTQSINVYDICFMIEMHEHLISNINFSLNNLQMRGERIVILYYHCYLPGIAGRVVNYHLLSLVICYNHQTWIHIQYILLNTHTVTQK